MTDIRTSALGGIPYGDNSGRPSNPDIGRLYSNGEAQRIELYTSTGWNNIVQEVPGVSSISGQYLESQASNSIVVYGTNFVSGAIAYATGTNAVDVQATTTTFNSIVQLTATFSGLSSAYEPYDIKVVNPSNLFGILPDALYINQIPIWSTSSGTLGTFQEGDLVSVSISSSDPESTAITYSVSSGSLPGGLSLNSSTGVISGTAGSVSGDTTSNFSITASDGYNSVSRSFSITITELAPVWSTSTTLTAFTKNVAYSNTLVANDDSGSTPTYSIVSGSLPTGLSLNSSTGLISGTASTSLTATFTVRATDANSKYSDRTFTLPNSGPTWVTSAGALTIATLSSAYSATLSASDDGTLTYSVSSGSLPTGLTLNSSTGAITGTPTASGDNSFAVTVSDENGTSSTRSFSISVVLGVVANIAVSSGSGSWNSVSTSYPRPYGSMATAITKTKVLVCGGYDATSGGTAGNIAYVWTYGGSFTQVANMPTGVAAAGIGVVGNYAYVWGGCTNTSGTSSAYFGSGTPETRGGGQTYTATNATQRYDFSSNTWATRTSMPVSLYGCYGAPSGTKIYGFGGSSSSSGMASRDAYVYDTVADSWSTLTSRTPDAQYATEITWATSNLTGKLYGHGGWSSASAGNSGSANAKLSVFDPATNTTSVLSATGSSAINNPMTSNSHTPSGWLPGNGNLGYLFFLGGQYGSDNYMPVWDITAGSWLGYLLTASPSSSHYTINHSNMVLYPNTGSVPLFVGMGGYGWTHQVFTPATGTGTYSINSGITINQ